MILVRRVVLLFAASALMPVAGAGAADYEPPIFVEQAEEYVPVEVGSGWYLRGDIGYIFDNSYDDTQLAVTAIDEFAPFDPIRILSFEEDDTPVFGSVGFGYHFNDFLRADVNLGLLPREKFSTGGRIDGIDASASAENTYWTGIANGYIDLGTYAGLTPYVGAGVGVLYSKIELDARLGDLSASYSDRDYNFLYTLNAGASYQVAKNVSVDVGYQYLSSPDAPFVKIGDDGAEYGKGLDYHQVRVGLRYDLW
ncbi:outer membrane protein [Kumtagia ephedrae]|uniref:Porin family protein n=1 Tax=Kumtagia ephedrae TaxID=2116701 RepID=A0A2P7S466_9HYPH|nr:outer membrane protein [Mesorhizobium ephedrae]PSJ57276.1 porin family protein [Mesorhizobium ephedrae]